uniref:Uncharacterized protein n=1 Tax=viral metagenome TaxID=1070528 RepID=A0A6C0EV89_9ZZZZ
MIQKLKPRPKPRQKIYKGGTESGAWMVGESPPSAFRSFLNFIGRVISFIWRVISFVFRMGDVFGNFTSIIVIIIAYFILQMVLDAIHATFKPLTKIPFVGKEIKKADDKIARTVWGLFMMWLEKLGLMPPSIPTDEDSSEQNLQDTEGIDDMQTREAMARETINEYNLNSTSSTNKNGYSKNGFTPINITNLFDPLNIKTTQ